MNLAKRTRIHWVRYEPTFYYDDFLRVLAAEPGIYLLVHYGIPASVHYPWRTKLREGYSSTCLPSEQRVDWRLLRTILQERDAFYVMAGWWTPTMVLALNLLILLGRRFAVFTDSPEVDGRRGGRIKRCIRRHWLRFVFRRAMAVLSTGNFGVRRVVQMGCPTDKAVDYPYFVSLPPVENAQRDRPNGDGPIRFFGSGRLVVRKGYDVALRALAKVNREMPSGFFRFLLAGTGPEEDRLKVLAHQLGVHDRVDFLGWLEPTQICDVLSKADAFVHPAVTLDPFAVSVAEAMAFGLPILGSNVCGCVADRVTDGVNGFVHEAGDSEQLADHMLRLLACPAVIPQMGQQSRRIAEQWPPSRGVEIIKGLVRSSAA